MPIKGVKCAKYREERQNGLTFQEIADKYGVSRQCVAQACSGLTKKHFRYHKEDRFAYPNLCKWMNDNRVSTSELLQMMGLEPVANNHERIRAVCCGKLEPRKHTIDKLLSVTGTSYEWLFDVSGGGGADNA